MENEDGTMSRREFLRKASASGIGLSAAALLVACGPTSIPLPTEEKAVAPTAPIVPTGAPTQAPTVESQAAAASTAVPRTLTAGSVAIEWLGHGSFKFVSPTGLVVLVDPWLETNPVCPAAYRTVEGFSKVDIVLFTHGHVDHFMLPDVTKIIERFGPKVIAPWELSFFIKSEMPKADTLTFNLANKGATTLIADLLITMVGADHSSGAQLTGFEGVNKYVGEPCGYIIEFENGFRVYHSGDTGLMADMGLIIGDYYAPDLAILPIGGVFTMGPREAAYACKLIRPKYVIPEHFATFPVLTQTTAEFVGYVKQFAPSTQVVELTAGTPVTMPPGA